jgi:hypothetical protein
MLLPEKVNSINHLLRSLTRGFEPLGESGVLPFQKLDAFRGHDSLDSG